MTGVIDQPFRAIPDLVRAHAAQRPRHAALVHAGRVLDYAGLDALMGVLGWNIAA